eukprot:GHVL01015035.1.p1 GENE.GHVL01015035.1~~GHVL01015035.1.p1  ORF type:complete len:288 (+),score=54.87 GHVL01015035.1:25-864(+)
MSRNFYNRINNDIFKKFNKINKNKIKNYEIYQKFANNKIHDSKILIQNIIKNPQIHIDIICKKIIKIKKIFKDIISASGYSKDILKRSLSGFRGKKEKIISDDIRIRYEKYFIKKYIYKDQIDEFIKFCDGYRCPAVFGLFGANCVMAFIWGISGKTKIDPKTYQFSRPFISSEAILNHFTCSLNNFKMGRFYTLVTANFLHMHLFEWLYTVSILATVGRRLELYIGSRLFLFIYMSAGAMGNFLQSLKWRKRGVDSSVYILSHIQECPHVWEFAQLSV